MLEDILSYEASALASDAIKVTDSTLNISSDIQVCDCCISTLVIGYLTFKFSQDHNYFPLQVLCFVDVNLKFEASGKKETYHHCCISKNLLDIPDVLPLCNTSKHDGYHMNIHHLPYLCIVFHVVSK